MHDFSFDGDADLIAAIRTTLLRVNDYILDPGRKNFVDLLGEDLIKLYGRERIERVFKHAFEYHPNRGELGVPLLSRKFTALFRQFNDRYFDGKLPSYKVTVLYEHFDCFLTDRIWYEGQVLN